MRFALFPGRRGEVSGVSGTFQQQRPEQKLRGFGGHIQRNQLVFLLRDNHADIRECERSDLLPRMRVDPRQNRQVELRLPRGKGSDVKRGLRLAVAEAAAQFELLPQRNAHFGSVGIADADMRHLLHDVALPVFGKQQRDPGGLRADRNFNCIRQRRECIAAQGDHVSGGE